VLLACNQRTALATQNGGACQVARATTMREASRCVNFSTISFQSRVASLYGEYQFQRCLRPRIDVKIVNAIQNKCCKGRLATRPHVHLERTLNHSLHSIPRGTTLERLLSSQIRRQPWMILLTPIFHSDPMALDVMSMRTQTRTLDPGPTASRCTRI
jgi:hypothetical protein